MRSIKNSFIISFCSVLFVIASPVKAGCGDSKAECYFYKGKKLVSKSSCKITECANVSGGLQRWEWKNGKKTDIDVQDGTTTVNGKPGFSKVKGKLFCYGINGSKDELYCSNN